MAAIEHREEMRRRQPAVQQPHLDVVEVFCARSTEDGKGDFVARLAVRIAGARRDDAGDRWGCRAQSPWRPALRPTCRSDRRVGDRRRSGGSRRCPSPAPPPRKWHAGRSWRCWTPRRCSRIAPRPPGTSRPSGVLAPRGETPGARSTSARVNRWKAGRGRRSAPGRRRTGPGPRSPREAASVPARSRPTGTRPSRPRRAMSST